MATYAMVKLFSRISPPTAHVDNFEITVDDPDMIVVGGGIAGSENPGKLITASFPNAYLSSWVVSAKDHLVPDAAPITGYAIGLKVWAYDPGTRMPSMSPITNAKLPITKAELLSHIHLTSQTSPVTPHPQAFAPLWPDCALLGGGFQVNYGGAGNLATASYPSTKPYWSAPNDPNSPLGWIAESKDHLEADPASITSYAIGLHRGTFGAATGYAIEFTYPQGPPDGAGPTGHPTSSAILPMDTEYLLTGGGAVGNSKGAGSLLWKLEPFIDGQLQSFRAASKDHLEADPCNVNAYVVGVRITRA